MNRNQTETEGVKGMLLTWLVYSEMRIPECILEWMCHERDSEREAWSILLCKDTKVYAQYLK